MSSLRARTIRLAYENPDLRAPLLAALKESAPLKVSPPVRFEIAISGSFRDYRTDPEAPVQSLDVSPRRLAFVQVYGPDAKSVRTQAEAIVARFEKDWASGRAFTVYVPNPYLPSGTRQKDYSILPSDSYEKAEILVSQAMRSGDLRPVLRKTYDRKTGRWTKC